MQKQHQPATTTKMPLLLIWNRWLRFIEIDLVGNIWWCQGKNMPSNHLARVSHWWFRCTEKRAQRGKKTWTRKICSVQWWKKRQPMEACKTNGNHTSPHKKPNNVKDRHRPTTKLLQQQIREKIAEFYRFYLFASLWFSMLPLLFSSLRGRFHCSCPFFSHSLISKSWYAHITIIYINFLLSHKLL